MQGWKTRHFWTDGGGSIFLAIFVALFIRWAFFEAYVIPSGSMLPSLLVHDHIFVNKFVYGLRVPFSEKWLVKFSEPKRGDVIVFKYPLDMSIFYIKRVVGLSGDKIFYDNGVLYVNDKPMAQRPPEDPSDFLWLRYQDFEKEGVAVEDMLHLFEDLEGYSHSILLRKEPNLNRFTFGPITVPEGKLFVMGDNRDNSNDSRMWRGESVPQDMWHFLPKEYILGRASIVWLSCEETLPVVSFLCNPMTIRFGRFFHAVK